MALENIRPPLRRDFPGITDAGYRYLQELARWINDNAGWVNIPDITAVGYVIENPIVPDGTWREIDLSSVVPDQARGVFLKLEITSGPTVNRKFKVRRYGDTTGVPSLEQTTQVTQQAITAYGIVGLSRNRKIEYFGTNTADWDNIELTVLGWFI